MLNRLTRNQNLLLNDWCAFELNLACVLLQSDAKWLLAAVVVLTLMNSGVSVAFSYLSRDFWSALNAKDAEHFQEVLVKFFGALCAGVPVVVMGSYQVTRPAFLLEKRW